MKKLFVFAIIMFVFLAGCETTRPADREPGFFRLERKYIEQYGEPTARIISYSKELNFDYRVYRWDNIGIQVTFAKDIEQSGHDQWFIYIILAKCPKCGKYHIEVPMV